MAYIFRILILLVSVAIVITAEFKFDYTPENAKRAIEEYQDSVNAGAPRLKCDLVNTRYAAVLNKDEQNLLHPTGSSNNDKTHGRKRLLGIQFSAADLIVLRPECLDSTDSSCTNIPIALDKRPGIKTKFRTVEAFGRVFAKVDKVFYISEMRIEVGEDRYSKNYLELRVTFSDSRDKNSVQVKMPLFAKSEKQAIGNEALNINVPIIRELQIYNSIGERNNHEYLTDVWWMKDVLKSALHQSTDKTEQKCTEIYITSPVITDREEIKKWLNMDFYLKRFMDE